MTLYNRDCFEILPEIKEQVSLVFADLPYGTTACEWDSVLSFDTLWPLLLRVTKKDAFLVFTAHQPFTSVLVTSNIKMFSHEVIWEKPNGTNPFQAKFMPMKKHESVVVFKKGSPVYTPQMVAGEPYKWNAVRVKGEAGGISQTRETPIDNDGTRYPGSVVRFQQDRGLHPTQKPAGLLEWIIKSYSVEGDTVIDPTMGSGTTGIACLNTNRVFIGIEKDEKYFRVAEKRLGARCDECFD